MKKMDSRPSVENMPLTLYEITIQTLSNNLGKEKNFKSEYRDVPNYVLFDLYYQLYRDRRLCLLSGEFSNIDVFARLLKIPDRRVKLLQCFQCLKDHARVTVDLIESYVNKCVCTSTDDKDLENIIDTGLRLGAFLSDSGWFVESAEVLDEVKNLCLKYSHLPRIECKLLDCYHRLLHVQAVYCEFNEANKTLCLVFNLIDQLEEKNKCPNLAGLYAEFSILYFIRSEYDQAYHWSVKALKNVNSDHPPGIIVDILRQASKACVVKREFKKAGLLIRQAVNYACEIFPEKHPKVSDVLMDYGFYLLNSDSILQSVKVYEAALDIRKHIFHRKNLKVAAAHEDLAYALYVNEYSSGRFYKAREHAEQAITIMESLIPNDHLMLASAKRVKALILEEIALDMPGNLNNSDARDKLEYLKKSEELHLAALRLSLNAFGEKNVQTAKHYGNLGRLYQSMMEYEKAEKMHLRAISIKEELLGEQDYEVGLSVGHLASLYNYHMEKFREAEKLYQRSIAISLKLFGESYSGLEYDYRGLVHVYSELNEVYRMIDYTNTLSNWKDLRDQIVRDEDFPVNGNTYAAPLQETLDTFFNMS